MANINDKRNFLRQELLKHADQVAALRSKAAINDTTALVELTQHAAELQKHAAALVHLLDVEAEKVIVEIPSIPAPPDTSKNSVLPPATEIKQPVAEIKQPVPEANPVLPPATEKKLPELKSMIGLNEKMMIIRSLFGGDSTSFDTAIAKLNSCTSKTDSDSTLSSLATERNWKTDSEAFVALQSIVRRRTA